VEPALQIEMGIGQKADFANSNTSPRTRIEEAILKHLRQSTPRKTNDKRTRIKRTFAECLTSTECIARMEAAGTSKRKKAAAAKIQNVCEAASSASPSPHTTHDSNDLYNSSSFSDFDSDIVRYLLDDDNDDSIHDPSSDEFATKFKIGQHIAMTYDDKWFAAQIERRLDDELDIKCMKNKGLNKFMWSGKPDIFMCQISDVLCLVSEPVKVNDRYMSLSKEDYDTAVAAFNQKGY